MSLTQSGVAHKFANCAGSMTMRRSFGALGLLGVLALSVACRSHSKPVIGPVLSSTTTGLCGDDASIEDAEDGNHQVLLRGNRSGYWFTFVDAEGSTVNPPAAASGGLFQMASGGSNCSERSVHLSGSVIPATPRHETFAGMGVNLTQPMSFYDASRYSGVGFYARRGPGSLSRVRFAISDVNTNPDGNICSECFNDFAISFDVSETWSWVVVPFAALKQDPSWGDPKPPYLATHKIVSLQWDFEGDNPGTYDLWVDDLRFVGCANAATQPTAPEGCTAASPESSAESTAPGTGVAGAASPAPTAPRTVLTISSQIAQVVALHSACKTAGGLLRGFTKVWMCEELPVGRAVQKVLFDKVRTASSAVRMGSPDLQPGDDLSIEASNLEVKDVSQASSDDHRYVYDLELAVAAKTPSGVILKMVRPMRINIQIPAGSVVSSEEIDEAMGEQLPLALGVELDKIVNDIIAGYHESSAPKTP